MIIKADALSTARKTEEDKLRHQQVKAAADEAQAKVRFITVLCNNIFYFISLNLE